MLLGPAFTEFPHSDGLSRSLDWVLMTVTAGLSAQKPTHSWWCSSPPNPQSCSISALAYPHSPKKLEWCGLGDLGVGGIESSPPNNPHHTHIHLSHALCSNIVSPIPPHVCLISTQRASVRPPIMCIREQSSLSPNRAHSFMLLLEPCTPDTSVCTFSWPTLYKF